MDTESGRTHSRRLRARDGLATGQRVHGSLDDVQRLVVDASAVGKVLPEAIAQEIRGGSQALQVALEPVVADTVRSVARRNADLFGELLAPTIGAAVRKAVSDAMAALMQRVNETLERSLSIEGFRWRLEAYRTGLAFADVVMARTLVYRVEQVFLLHVPTGLVLQHVIAEGAPSNDPDQVSAMLSAIDTFSREAFHERAPGVHLQEISIGDLRVWIDWDHSTALAAVIRGAAPQELRDVIRETRERVYLSHRKDLATFASDVTPFATAKPTLQEVLQERRVPPRKRAQIVLTCMLVGVLAFAAGFWAKANLRHHHESDELHRLHDVLAAEPGLVVTSAAIVDGHYQVLGLRDPLARDPAEVVAQAGLRPADLRFSPFESLTPQIIVDRAQHVLEPPDTARLELDGSTLRISGEAPRAWIDRALTVSGALAGVSRVDHEELYASEQLLALRSAAALLEEQRITFAPESATLDVAALQASEAAADLVRELRNQASYMAFTACVTAKGSTDPSGTPESNAALASQRAEAVAASMRQSGAAPDAMVGAEPGHGTQARDVRFSVLLRSGHVACETSP